MSPRPLLPILAAIVLGTGGALCFSGTAYAVEAAAPPPMSGKEMERFAQSAATDLRDATKKVLAMIESAQKNKDFVLLNCLNDKLIQLRGLLKVADDSSLGLSEALARENLDLQEHNYKKVVVARERGTVYATEADSCIGELGSMLTGGGTRLVVTVEGGEAGAIAPVGVSSSGASRPPDASGGE